MARKKYTDRINRGILDQLVKERGVLTTLDFESLAGELKNALAEWLLSSHRNGSNPRIVETNSERVVLDISRDRQRRFDPALFAKCQRNFPSFDDKITALYARGMSTRDIQAQIEEIYEIGISPQLVSAIPDAFVQQVAAQRNRPLEVTYAVVYFDALRVKIRDEGMVRNKAVKLAVGIEGAGQKDVLIAVVDGLKGFPEGITATDCVVQTCIVHLIRYSIQFASWKGRKALARALKPIYTATNAEAAAAALDEFEQGPWGSKYPLIAAGWQRRWAQGIPLFGVAPEVRKDFYTTYAIESLNSQVRKAVCDKGQVPSDEAATKLIFLALRNVIAKWKRLPKGDAAQVDAASGA